MLTSNKRFILLFSASIVVVVLGIYFFKIDLYKTQDDKPPSTLFSLPMLSTSSLPTYYASHKYLFPEKYPPLRVGEIVPTGWLKGQIDREVNGLAGHLCDFFDVIRNSNWIGGQLPCSLNENIPYWLNGVVPLVAVNKDARLKEIVFKYIDHIVTHQQPNGWLDPSCCDPWGSFSILMAFTQYCEINPTDTRIIPSMLKFLHQLDKQLDTNPLTTWAKARYQELVYSLWWLIDNQPYEHEFLLQLAYKLRGQGTDWPKVFSSPTFPKEPCTRPCWDYSTHGVNVAQGIKDSALWYRVDHDPVHIKNAIYRTYMLDTYHGRVDGTFSGSEHLAGLHPSQGTETCLVVEAMFSYEVSFSVFGNISDADRVERIAYNSLPGSFTSDQWNHVYVQQHNQINAKPCNPHIFVTDINLNANLYGLAPHYHCCTVNFPQGWPKFVTHMVARTQDDGLVVVYYGPINVETTIKGKPVRVEVITDYPFSESLDFRVTTKIQFNLYLRIPYWASSPTLKGTDGGVRTNISPGTLYPVNCSVGLSSFSLYLTSKIKPIVNSFTKSVAISKGALIYSLNLNKSVVKKNNYYLESYDLEMTPTQPWNYALEIDMLDPTKCFVYSQGDITQIPFSTDAPVKISAKARKIPWEEKINAADAPPPSPVKSTEPLEDITLIPYGAADLRITEFPYIDVTTTPP
eukprot:TRINITY_DN5169_c0_g1_i1.p1 TRINITY_DN5169_c0_g1~~TRINITY_DN5169_c0_g1_i1.p1  ORF type:complete len:686 (+),score=98.59 TRINITY_DN5169_c0_g1_i1:38-2095(+)